MNISMFSVIVLAFFAIEIVAFPNFYQLWFGSSNNNDNENYNDDTNSYRSKDLDLDSESRICRSSLVHSLREKWSTVINDDRMMEILSECEPIDFIIADGLSSDEAVELSIQIKQFKNNQFPNLGFVDRLKNKLRKLKAKVLYKIDSWKSSVSSTKKNVRNYFVRKFKNPDREPQFQSELKTTNFALANKSIENVQSKANLTVEDNSKKVTESELSDKLEQKSKADDANDNKDNDNDNDWEKIWRDEKMQSSIGSSKENDNESFTQKESKTDDFFVDSESFINFTTLKSSTTNDIVLTTENQF